MPNTMTDWLFRVLASAFHGVYPRVEMRLRLLISLLILALSGANAIAVAMCPGLCASSKSEKTETAHQHHHAAPPSNENPHVHGHGMRCAECPSTSGVSLNSGCGNLVQDEAIRGSSSSQDKSRGLSLVATLTANAPKTRDNPEHPLRLDTSGNLRSSPPSVALRI
jgi:hypothetical protein